MIEIEYVEPTLIDKIRLISEKYSKKHQWAKAIEEVHELLRELILTSEPSENLWLEMVDVAVMSIQIAMQHNAMDKLGIGMEYKVSRQLKRMLEEGLITTEEYEKYQSNTRHQFN